jgi:hypothetical protein
MTFLNEWSWVGPSRRGEFSISQKSGINLTVMRRRAHESGDELIRITVFLEGCSSLMVRVATKLSLRLETSAKIGPRQGIS